MKSIIFNQHQVNHALSNKEGMFRVVVENIFDWYGKPAISDNLHRIFTLGEDDIADDSVGAAPYRVGKTIFVKEPFNIFCSQLVYKFNHEKNDKFFWMRANRMKQEHSRLTLRIKSVKVERLQDISEEDAFKSGEIRTDEWTGTADDLDYVSAFKHWWNSTHKKPEEKWEANPFCFAYEYEVVR